MHNWDGISEKCVVTVDLPNYKTSIVSYRYDAPKLKKVLHSESFFCARNLLSFTNNNNNNNNNFISIALLCYVQGALQSRKQHYW